jgi:hypothetical protein
MLASRAYTFALFTGISCCHSDEPRCLSLSLQDKRGIDRTHEEEQLEIEHTTSSHDLSLYSS